MALQDKGADAPVPGEGRKQEDDAGQGKRDADQVNSEVEGQLVPQPPAFQPAAQEGQQRPPRRRGRLRLHHAG